MSDDELDLLSMYRNLHDGLSDMVESGRLSPAVIPDDYQWLVETLAEASALGSRINKLLAEEGGYDGFEEHASGCPAIDGFGCRCDGVTLNVEKE